MKSSSTNEGVVEDKSGWPFGIYTQVMGPLATPSLYRVDNSFIVHDVLERVGFTSCYDCSNIHLNERIKMTDRIALQLFSETTQNIY